MIFPISCSGLPSFAQEPFTEQGTDRSAVHFLDARNNSPKKQEQKIVAEKACHFFSKAWVLICRTTSTSHGL
jgi:hypothetical protein